MVGLLRSQKVSNCKQRSDTASMMYLILGHLLIPDSISYHLTKNRDKTCLDLQFIDFQAVLLRCWSQGNSARFNVISFVDLYALSLSLDIDTTK